MTQPFEKRVVVVTGGTGVLGQAVVATLLDQGATCHVTASSADDTARFPLADRAKVHALDLRQEDQVSALYASIEGLWASIHVAGGFVLSPIAEAGAAVLRDMVEINTLTCLLCCRAAVLAMRRLPGVGGRIVNVAARPALHPTSGMIAYAASKAAVASITQCLAEEVRAEDILVNAIVPSTIDTPANRRSRPNADFALWPKPSQLADAVAFLASPTNTLTTGTLLPVFGRA